MTRSNFLLPVFAVLTACAFTAAALATGQSPAPKPAAGDAASASRPPMIVQNPNGTMTIQMTRRERQTGIGHTPSDRRSLHTAPVIVEAKKKAGAAASAFDAREARAGRPAPRFYAFSSTPVRQRRRLFGGRRDIPVSARRRLVDFHRLHMLAADQLGPVLWPKPSCRRAGRHSGRACRSCSPRRQLRRPRFVARRGAFFRLLDP